MKRDVKDKDGKKIGEVEDANWSAREWSIGATLVGIGALCSIGGFFLMNESTGTAVAIILGGPGMALLGFCFILGSKR